MLPKQQLLSVDKVVVTGSAGFVGRRVVEALRSAGVSVWPVYRLGNVAVMPEAGIYLDLQDAASVEQFLLDISPDCVIHLAASRNRGEQVVDYRENYQSNLQNTLNIVQACRKLPLLRRFIFTGSCDEYGSCAQPYHEGLREEPNNAYGLSKLATTQLLSAWHRTYDFPVVIFRPSVVYGPGQGVEMFIPALARTLASGRVFPMTNGDQLRDFLFVDDLVDAILMAVDDTVDINGMVINVGSGISVRIRDVALMTADLIGSEARRLIQFGAIPYRSNEVMDYFLSIGRAAQVLGWHPVTTLSEGLKRTVDHITGNGRGT